MRRRPSALLTAVLTIIVCLAAPLSAFAARPAAHRAHAHSVCHRATRRGHHGKRVCRKSSASARIAIVHSRKATRRRHAGTRKRHVTTKKPTTSTPAPTTTTPAPTTSAPSATPTASTASAAVSGGLVVGLNANVSGWGNASTAPRLDQVASQTGAKWLREEFRWNVIEPSPGQFDFSYYDHFMLLAAQRGEHVLPLLYETPSWAGANYNSIPSDPTAFAQYVAAVVGRYGANGTFWQQYPSLAGSAIHTWEIWNEPYLGTGDNGDYDPAAYAQLVKASAIAGRSQDPGAQFLMAAEMQSAQDANGTWQWWIDALYQAVPDLNNYFNGVAVHDYGNSFNALTPMVAGQAYANYGDVQRIDDIRQQFLDHGANKSFWITEAGWSTCTTDTRCVTPNQQAGNLAALFGMIHGSWSGFVQAAFIYSYGDGSQPSQYEDGFGLTNLDGSAKPALAVFQAQAALSAS